MINLFFDSKVVMMYTESQICSGQLAEMAW